MKLIFERFLDVCKIYDNKIALWCDGEQKTYTELRELICRYANYLINRGVVRGDIIGVPMNNSMESVALLFAVSAIGAGVAPINPTLPVDAINAAFDAADVKHIIARKSFFKMVGEDFLKHIRGCLLCLDAKVDGIDCFEDVMASSDEQPNLSEITGTEPFILTMTSGSTGVPKPIVLTQINKIKRAEAHIELYGITDNDNILAATPLYHSLAERLVIIPLIVGATSVLLPRFTPVLWLNCVKEQKVTFTIAVSAQLSQISQLLSDSVVPEISTLRCVVSSSALLTPHVRNELIDKLNCDFHEMYGTSECSTVTSINFRESGNKISSVGRPLPGVKLRIVDKDKNILGYDEVGEIIVDTPLRCAGYFKVSEAMEDSLANGYFYTGDLGRIDRDGYLYFVGRKKELIITGGVNVYPKDIEEKLRNLRGVCECAAFAYADEQLGEVVAVAVVPERGVQLTKRDIKIFCARNLADFQQPHKVFFLDNLPKNTMGKIVKLKLTEVVAGMED